MPAISPKQIDKENDSWLAEAKEWKTEAAIWEKEETKMVSELRAQAARVETLLLQTSEHVAALVTHLAAVNANPYGTNHEKERDAHHHQRQRHAAVKHAHHDQMAGLAAALAVSQGTR
jgi:hypothetical protein